MKPNTRILSIMIPVMKDRDNMLKTYQSLQGILGDEVELVIQDHKGLSELRNVISDPHVVLLEEDDTSIAQANNLGAQQANGKYLMFWGAGELAIMPGFASAVEKLKTNRVDILFNCIRQYPFNRVITPSPQNIKTSMDCQTPGAMISKELFFRCGMLDMTYQVATDYAMFVSLLKATTSYVVTQDVVVDFLFNGLSSVARAFEGYVECELIRMRAYNKHPILAALDLIATGYSYLRQNVRIQNSPPPG